MDNLITVLYTKTTTTTTTTIVIVFNYTQVNEQHIIILLMIVRDVFLIGLPDQTQLIDQIKIHTTIDN